MDKRTVSPSHGSAHRLLLSSAARVLCGLALLCAVSLVASTYNPFIYFRF